MITEMGPSPGAKSAWAANKFGKFGGIASTDGKQSAPAKRRETFLDGRGWDN
jgi:hypothetical protein